jgi:hypothetical protein
MKRRKAISADPAATMPGIRKGESVRAYIGTFPVHGKILGRPFRFHAKHGERASVVYAIRTINGTRLLFRREDLTVINGLPK